MRCKTFAIATLVEKGNSTAVTAAMPLVKMENAPAPVEEMRMKEESPTHSLTSTFFSL